MKTREKSIILGLVTVLFIILMATLLNVKSSARENDILTASRKVEAEYRNEIRDILTDAGMKNPGITMTKETPDGVNISYNVVVYVPAHLHLTEMEKEKLMEALYDIELSVSNAKVTFSFS